MEETSVGKTFTATALQAELIGAPTINVEKRDLKELKVSGAKFGVSAVEIKNGTGVRLHVYLFNPSEEPVQLPLPDPQLFTLVDQKGRELELRAGPDLTEEETAQGTKVTVPVYERVELTLLFGQLTGSARKGVLKVGDVGMIKGLPLNTAAVDTTDSSPWNSLGLRGG